MGRIKIKHRLLISFCTLIFFFALNLATYFWGKSQKDHELKNLSIATDAQVTALTLQKMISDTKKHIGIVQEMTQNAGEEEMSPMSKDEVNAFKFQIEKVTQKVNHLKEVSSDGKLIPSFTTSYTKLKNDWISFYSLCGGVDHKKAMILLITQAEPTSEELLMILNELISSLEKRVQKAQVKFDNISKLVNKISIGLFIFSLVFAILISLAVASYISQRIETLQDGTKKLKQGDLEARVDIKGADELANLGIDFNSMADSLLQARSELKNSKENISNILNNLSQGFLTFDEAGNVGKDYSKIVESMFVNHPENYQFDEIIRKFTMYEEEEFIKWKQLAFSGVVDFDSLTGLLPAHFENEHGKKIQLSYRKISGENGELKNVICIAEDKTYEVELKDKALRQEAYAAFILHITKHPDVFKDFCLSFNRNVSQIQSILEQELDLEKIEIIARYLHTIKGDSSYNHIRDLVLESECTEELVFSIKRDLVEKKSIPLDKIDSLKHAIMSLDDIFKKFLNNNNDLVTEKVEQEDLIKRERSKLEDYFKNIEAGVEKALDSLKQYLFYEDVSILFNKYAGLVAELAKKQNKLVKFNVESNGIVIQHNQFTDVSNSFIHLFRNSVDHGIELPSERVEFGKPETAKIEVVFNDIIKDNGKELMEFVIKDDGRGIDFKKLANKAIEKGMTNKKSFEDFNQDELQDLVFMGGLSSKNEVTELSGRGVGVDTVKYEVEKLHGSIKIDSQENQGTKFIIQLPLR